MATDSFVERRQGRKTVREYAVNWTGSKYRDEHPAHRSIPYWFMNGVISVPTMAREDDLHVFEVAKALRAQVLSDDGPIDPKTWGVLPKPRKGVKRRRAS